MPLTPVLVIVIALILVIGGLYFSGNLNLTGNPIGMPTVAFVPVCTCTIYVFGQVTGSYTRPSLSGQCTGVGEYIGTFFTPGMAISCGFAPPK